MADSPQSNADIEFLISTFEQNLHLLQDDDTLDIPPASREFLKAFMQHSQHSSSNVSHLTEFLDCGTRLMGYLSKHGFSQLVISEDSIQQCLESFIDPNILKQPLEQALSAKKKGGQASQDEIAGLQEVLKLLDQVPLDKAKIMEALKGIEGL